MQVTVCLEPADSMAHIVDMVGPFRAPTPGWVWPARMGGVVGMRRKAVVQAGDGCDVMGWFEEGGERGDEGGRSDERVAEEMSKSARLLQGQAYIAGLAAGWMESSHRKAPPWI